MVTSCVPKNISIDRTLGCQDEEKRKSATKEKILEIKFFDRTRQKNVGKNCKKRAKKKNKECKAAVERKEKKM